MYKDREGFKEPPEKGIVLWGIKQANIMCTENLENDCEELDISSIRSYILRALRGRLFSMEKNETLKDGTNIIIRELHINDLDRLMKFYSALPIADRKYLRIDVTDRKIVEQRIKLIETGNVFRLVALSDDEIIADGALELSAEEWRKHQGELRVIVARPFQHKGLGMTMVRELYFLAVEKKVDLVVVKMMRPQIAAQRIFRKLGFREELLIPDYVEDRSGKKQDLIIMTCNIKDLWDELEHFYSDSDWQRCR